MARRNYTNLAVNTILTGAVLPGDIVLNVASTQDYPSPPFLAGIDRGLAAEEIVLVTAMTANTFTVERGYDGTVAVEHTSGSSIEHVVAAMDYREANDHVNSTSGVHGISGAVVGTTDAQTLTNKTLSGSSNTFSAIPQSAITGLTSALDGKVSKSGDTINGDIVLSGTASRVFQAETNSLAYFRLRNLATQEYMAQITLNSSSGQIDLWAGGNSTAADTHRLVMYRDGVINRINYPDTLGRPIPFAFAAGTASLQFSNSWTATPVRVSLPSGRFTVTPMTFVTLGHSAMAISCWTGGNNSDYFDIYGARIDEVATTVSRTVHWMAIQMTPTQANG